MAKSHPLRAQPPAWLVGVSARAQWRRVVPEMQRLNLYNESLRDVVGRYCLHFAEWIDLTRKIRKEGQTVAVVMTNGKNTMLRVNPAVRARDITERSLIDLEDRFGFSPLARFRLTGFQAATPRTDLFGQVAGKQDVNLESPMPPPAAEGASPIGALRRTIN